MTPKLFDRPRTVYEVTLPKAGTGNGRSMHHLIELRDHPNKIVGKGIAGLFGGFQLMLSFTLCIHAQVYLQREILQRAKLFGGGGIVIGQDIQGSFVHQ